MALFAGAPPAAAPWRPQRFADGYSRWVAILKRILPTTGLTLLLLVAAWPRLAPLLDSVRFAFPGIDLREARDLKMLNPRYSGIDRYNRPYVVTAAVGRQVPNHGNLMSLEKPRAELIAHGGAKIVMTAASGIYQSQTQLLDLFRRVTLVHQNGTRFITRRAHADFSDNTAEGDDPIEGHGPSGDIWGRGFRVLDRGDTILFTGKSYLVLKGSRPSRAAASPAALPPEIMHSAGEVAAAAAASPVADGTFSASSASTGPAGGQGATCSYRGSRPPLAETSAASGAHSDVSAERPHGDHPRQELSQPIPSASRKSEHHAG